MHARGPKKTKLVCVVHAVRVSALMVCLVAAQFYSLEGFYSNIKLFIKFSAVLFAD